MLWLQERISHIGESLVLKPDFERNSDDDHRSLGLLALLFLFFGGLGNLLKYGRIVATKFYNQKFNQIHEFVTNIESIRNYGLVLTVDVGNVEQLLGQELRDLQRDGLFLLLCLAGMSLLGAVDDGLSQPLGIHRGHESEEVLLLWLTMTFVGPGIRDVGKEFFDVLDLLPHVGDGELRPLRNFHRRDLEAPEDVLLASEDLVQESHGTILLFGEKDVLNGERKDNLVSNLRPDTYGFVDHEVVERLLGLVFLAQLLHGVLIRFKKLVCTWTMCALGLTVHEEI